MGFPRRRRANCSVSLVRSRCVGAAGGRRVEETHFRFAEMAVLFRNTAQAIDDVEARLAGSARW